MAYTVVLRHNPSGEERLIPQEGEWDDSADFMWVEGNYGCDCNRALFFYNWSPESEEQECGEDTFSLPRVILADGTAVEIENPAHSG